MTWRTKGRNTLKKYTQLIELDHKIDHGVSSWWRLGYNIGLREFSDWLWVEKQRLQNPVRWVVIIKITKCIVNRLISNCAMRTVYPETWIILMSQNKSSDQINLSRSVEYCSKKNLWRWRIQIDVNKIYKGDCCSWLQWT